MKICSWFCDLVYDINILSLIHLSKDHSKYGQIIFQYIQKVKDIVPPCLRICDSIFTQVALVADFYKPGFIPLHVDKNDYFNSLLFIGYDNYEGGTVYFDGIDAKDVEKNIMRYLSDMDVFKWVISAIFFMVLDIGVTVTELL